MTYEAKRKDPVGPLPFEFIAPGVDKDYLKTGTSETQCENEDDLHSNIYTYRVYRNVLLGVYDISVYPPNVLQGVVNRAKANKVFVEDKDDNLIGMVKDIRVTYNTIGNSEYGMMFATIEIDDRNPGVTSDFLQNWYKVFSYVGAEYQRKETSPILSFNFTATEPYSDVIVSFD